MNCEKIQELILTDYLDGEMDEKQKEVILQHLANCADCQKFMVTAKITVNEPFSNVERINPDEFLWYKIKGVIEADKQRQSRPNRDILAMIRNRGRILIPAVIMAVVVIVVIWTDIVTIKQSPFYKTRTRDVSPEVSSGMNYYMENESVEYALMKNVNFETAIEEYFL
jgi:predicted anti-sigma-YlaC factor YlaD